MDNVTIISTTAVGWSTAEPVFSALKKHVSNIHIFAPKEIEKYLDKQSTQNCAVHYHNIKHTLLKHKIKRLFHASIIAILTPTEYSVNYNIILRNKLKRLSFIRYFIIFIKSILPKCNGRQINCLASRLLAPLTPNVFPSNNLLIITQFDSPIAALLSNSKQNRITLLESWDHAAKAPMGFTSHSVFLWNNKLKENWLKYQGDKNIQICFPYKLGYAIKRTGKQFTKTKDQYWLYATTFSEHSAEFFKEELIFIEHICKLAYNNKKRLYIKPKPNSNSIYFNHLAKTYNMVTVGEGQNTDKPNNYSLNREYNNIRIQELKQASLVINIGTTFAFDAASFGLPVFQIQIENKVEYPNISKIKDYPHLKEHIYSTQQYIYKLEYGVQNFKDTLKDLTEENLYIPHRYSEYLRKWLHNEKTEKTSTNDIVTALLTTDKKI